MLKHTVYKKIGKIKGTIGLEGRVVLLHDLATPRRFLKIEHIFIELQQDSYIPYFPKAISISGSNEITFLPDDLETVEDAQTLTGKNVYVEEEVFKHLFGATSTLGENLDGYKLIDKTSGIEVVIESVYTSAGQLLADVYYQEKEVIIPLSEDFLVELNPNKKEIVLNLPEGIWEL